MRNRTKTSPLLPLGLSLLLLSTEACRSGNSGASAWESISSIFEENVDPASITVAKESLLKDLADSTFRNKHIIAGIEELYSHNEGAPLWLDELHIADNVSQILNNISDLQLDGLHAEQYELSRLRNFYEQKTKNKDSLAHFDVLLSKNLVAAAVDLTFGQSHPGKVDSDWHARNDSTFSALPLLEGVREKQDDIFAAFRPQNPRYEMMRKGMSHWMHLKNDSNYLALKQQLKEGDNSSLLPIIQAELSKNEADSNLIADYRYLRHIGRTNNIDETLNTVLQREPEWYLNQLSINMERMRWLPNNADSTYIWANIAQAELDYFKDGINQFHTRTIVGALHTQTPTILESMKQIVLCPPWNLPHSIVLKDYGGRIPAKYEVYKGGKRVPNSMVNTSNYKQFNVRQPPGPYAALGYVKFNLPNKWDIYLHDTPNRSLFGNKKRTLSHGCVRVKDPISLAALVLEPKGYSKDSISHIIKKNKTLHIPTDHVPVYIIYCTVNADSSLRQLIYLQDVYKKDEALLQHLADINRHHSRL